MRYIIISLFVTLGLWANPVEKPNPEDYADLLQKIEKSTSIFDKPSGVITQSVVNNTGFIKEYCKGFEGLARINNLLHVTIDGYVWTQGLEVPARLLKENMQGNVKVTEINPQLMKFAYQGQTHTHRFNSILRDHSVKAKKSREDFRGWFLNRKQDALIVVDDPTLYSVGNAVTLTRSGQRIKGKVIYSSVESSLVLVRLELSEGTYRGISIAGANDGLGKFVGVGNVLNSGEWNTLPDPTKENLKSSISGSLVTNGKGLVVGIFNGQGIIDENDIRDIYISLGEKYEPIGMYFSPDALRFRTHIY